MNQEQTAVSPLAASFNPFTDPYLANPYPFLAQARAEEPVFYSPELDYWVVTRYDDIRQVFRDHDTFSARIALSPVHPFSEDVVNLLKTGGFTAQPVMSNCDPPDHSRIRKFTSRAFTPRRVNGLEPTIRRLVTEAIERFEKNGRCDLIHELIYDLPALVIFILLGIPDTDVPLVKSWSQNRLMLTWGRLTPEQQLADAKGLLDYWKYSQNHIQKKLTHPGDDFPSDLIRYWREDETLLTLNEITSIVYGLLIAGHETTTNASANALHTLLTHRHAWQALCANPALIPNAVEEILRYNPSVIAWRRQANRATTIGSIAIPAGAKLLLMLGSGNRDESHFCQAEQFDISREDAKDHLSFGQGIHYCFGAPLARLEMKILLEELTHRLPHLQLLPDQPYHFLPNTSFRGPQQLWVTW